MSYIISEEKKIDKRKFVWYNSKEGGIMELENYKGIGPKTLNCLHRLGIWTSNDLLQYYPFRFNKIERSNLLFIEDGESIIIDGIVESEAKVSYIRGYRDKMDFRLDTGQKLLGVTIFNRGYLKCKLVVGAKITVMGKYNKKRGSIMASDIKFSLLSDIPKIEPVYHVTTGINNSQLSGLIDKIKMDELVDYLPGYLVERYDFLSKKEAIQQIHHPVNYEVLKKAIHRLKFEELFLFMLKMNYLKSKTTETGLERQVAWEKIEQVIQSLPFVLTLDQIKAVKDIYQDLISAKRMNRLLQGDVGSGKTIVSFLALYINYLGGYQGALMAPTEILARQHYENIQKLFPMLKVGLLTGKLKAKEKRELYDKIEKNELQVIIGTHALISEKVKYPNLGLVITDEQHRFGVNQRSELKNKGITPDILYMSATPIPRTYAITLFGDMDISNIKTKPAGRKETITYLKKTSELKDVLALMYEQLKLGHQIYVIAPLIEESDKMELETVDKLKEKMELAFGKVCKIGVMHGKLNAKEKEDVMNAFQNNDIQILISTTVIEVGVDVGNATMMVVFDSYRFGLSALHQLRGRVGRNELQSYFVLISDMEAERLNILTKTNDGFEISDADFKLRGSGDMFGVRQSGDMQFKLADLKRDYKMVVVAKEDSQEFLDNYIQDIKYKHIANTLYQIDTLD